MDTRLSSRAICARCYCVHFTQFTVSSSTDNNPARSLELTNTLALDCDNLYARTATTAKRPAETGGCIAGHARRQQRTRKLADGHSLSRG